MHRIFTGQSCMLLNWSIMNDPYGIIIFFPGTEEKKHQSKKEKMKERRERWLNSEWFFFFHLLFLGPFPFPQISSKVQSTQSRNARMRIFLSLCTDLRFSRGPTGTSEMDMAGSLTPHPVSDACNRSGRSMRRVTQAPSEVIIIRI